MVQKVIKTGNSLAVTIPNKFVKVMAIKRGDQVKVEKRPDRGTLTYFFQGSHQLAISESVFRPTKRSRIKA